MKAFLKRSERVLWVIAILVAVSFAMTGFLRLVRADGSLYERVKIFHLSLNYLRNEYVEPQNDASLLTGAITGLVRSTGGSITNLLLASLAAPSVASNILPTVFNRTAADAMLFACLSDGRKATNLLRAGFTNRSQTSNVKPFLPSLAPGEILSRLGVYNRCLNFVRENAVPAVGDEQLVYGSVDGMVDSLRLRSTNGPIDDPFSHFLRPKDYKDLQVETTGKFGGLGIYITLREERLMVQSPIPDTPASRAGLKAYDWIQKIDGEPTKGLSIEDAMNRLRGIPGTGVTITVMRDGFGAPADYTLVREEIKIKSVVGKMMDADRIGYVRIKQFGETTASDLENYLKDFQGRELKGFILDLRGNPGGLLVAAWRVADMFLTKGLVVYTRGRTADSDQDFPADAQEYIPGVPLILLVDSGSASASEIVTGALKDDKRATVVGERTFGKGIVQTVKQMDNGTAISFTTAKYYTPSGVCIHGFGIAPDVEVKAPVWSDDQVKSFRRVMSTNFVQNFVRQNQEILKDSPAVFTSRVSGLRDRIRASGFDVDMPVLIRLVKIEAYRGDEFVYDLEDDTQLQAAVRLIKERK